MSPGSRACLVERAIPGMIYNNRYRVDAIIGEGGMAVVHRGYDLLLRRQVAIKVLRPQFAADDEFVQRFYQEAQAAARLSHPKIVNTYDVGENDGTNYIVQEYVAGETLAELIARQGRIPQASAVRYAQQICRALAAAHRADLLHRDIKPSNILITPDDDVRVADFGLAGAAETRGSNTDAIMGSIPYCAPEVLSGDAVTEAADLYSVGVVLYEMLTGNKPYVGASTQEVAAQQLRGPRDLDFPDDASPALRAMILKLLDPSPKERYRTAGESLSALRRVARGDGTADDDEPGPDSPTALLRRRAAARRAAAAADDAAPAQWSGRRLALFACGVLAVVLVIAVLSAVYRSGAQGLHMPDVSGKSVVDAVDALHQSGVDDVAIKQQHDPKTEIGLVDGTDPAAGTALQRGQKVTLLVSAGPLSAKVPIVTGKDVKTATATLASAGFSVVVGTAVHSDSVQVGNVAKTNPAGGEPAAQSDVVVIFPSSGPQTVTVPNLVALTDDAARTILAKSGLTLSISQVVASDNIPAHAIIDQDPSGGTPAKPHSVVTVRISGGPNAITVPDVVGGTIDDARRTLAQAGLSVGSVADAMDSGTTPGTVISQNPAANSPTAQGATIDLVVAVAVIGGSSAQPGATPSATPSAAPQPVPNVVGMTLEAARAALQAAGYVVQNVTVQPGSPPDAKVIATDPQAGATPAAGSNTVTITLGPGH
jgi:beta-lactam-binding protein with PASTA domain